MSRILITIEDLDDRNVETTIQIEGNNTVQYIASKLLTALCPFQNRILVDGVEYADLPKELTSE